MVGRVSGKLIRRGYAVGVVLANRCPRRLNWLCTVGPYVVLAVLWPALRTDMEERLRGSAIVLFTRDLRVHDNPALAAAVERSAA